MFTVRACIALLPPPPSWLRSPLVVSHFRLFILGVVRRVDGTHEELRGRVSMCLGYCLCVCVGGEAGVDAGILQWQRP